MVIIIFSLKIYSHSNSHKCIFRLERFRKPWSLLSISDTRDGPQFTSNWKRMRNAEYSEVVFTWVFVFFFFFKNKNYLIICSSSASISGLGMPWCLHTRWNIRRTPSKCSCTLLTTADDTSASASPRFTRSLAHKNNEIALSMREAFADWHLKLVLPYKV